MIYSPYLVEIKAFVSAVVSGSIAGSAADGSGIAGATAAFVPG